MPTTIISQDSPEPSNNSRPIDGLAKLAQRLAPVRVYLLLASLVVSIILLFLEAPFGDYHIHALSHSLALGGQSPLPTIYSWTNNQWQLAQLEVLIDNFFVFVYGSTLITWCYFFANNSLFVLDGSPEPGATARLMHRLGEFLAILVFVGMAADLIENVVINSWFIETITFVPPPWFWRIIVIVKFIPVVTAIWYISLHPLGILYSFLELLPTYSHAFQANSLRLRTYAQHGQEAMETIQQKAVDKENQEPIPPHEPQRKRFWWLLTLWTSLLGIQFLAYLLLFMHIVINLGQFDEVFFLLLSSNTSVLQLFPSIFWLLASLLCLSAMLYVTSKILLYLKPTVGIDSEDTEAISDALRARKSEFQLIQIIPLLFVALPFLITIVAFLSSYFDLPAAERSNPLYVYRFMVLIILLLSVGSLIQYLFYKGHSRSQDETSLALFIPSSPAKDYALLVRLAPKSILFGQGLLSLLLILFIPTQLGLFIAQAIGLHTILFLWLCAVAYLGTLLIQFNRLPIYPLALGLVIYVVVASTLNDNSAIRQTSESEKYVMNRPSFDTYFAQWYNNPWRKSHADTAAMPVVIIASEGGGIRAAGWTTACLHQLDSIMPGFGRYVFGISGVSGGGVGAATYVALRRAKAGPTEDSLVGHLTRQVVSSDLISPVVAAMLFRGGFHNFSPVPLTALDRSRWLEDAWENALFKQIPSNTSKASEITQDLIRTDSVHRILSKSFLQCFDSERDSTRFPLLFLNSSVAETGQKVILSPLTLDNTPTSLQNQQSQTNPFYDTVDLFGVTQHDIPFKTAAFLCARFPFVTSGGRAEGQLPNMKRDCKPAFHLIDGGYVENTGIMTAVQIIRRLQQITRKNPNAYKVRFYLLFLRNGQTSDQAVAKSTFRFLSEPLTGFLNAADRQGISLDQLVAYTIKRNSTDVANELGFSYINLALDRSTGHQYPLGWYLSPTATNELNEAARKGVTSLLKNQLTPFRNYITNAKPTLNQPSN